MDKKEEKCVAFIKSCTTAYSYKQQSLRNEQQLVAIIAELVALVNSIEERNERKSQIPQDKYREEGAISERARNTLLENIASQLTSVAIDIENETIRNASSIVEKIHAVISSIEGIDREIQHVYNDEAPAQYAVGHSNNEDDEYTYSMENQEVEFGDTGIANEEGGEIEEITLPLQQDDLHSLLPTHIVFDAIPLNRENIKILCTPLFTSAQWEYLDTVNSIGTSETVYGAIQQVVADITSIQSSELWELEHR